MTKDEAKLKIIELVKKYEQVIETRSISKYTEEETKKDFIQPFFHALGWDTQNKNEVTAEEHQQSGRPDYGFYLNSRCKFFVEAKALKTNLHNEEFANQAVRYSWNKGVIWAVLTDFESLKVFNAQVIDKSLFDKLFFEIKYSEYLDRFDQLWLLSRESFENNLLDIEGEKVGKKLQRVSVSELLYKDLNECRGILTNILGQCNPNLDKDLLDEGVQKLLDRLIFLRVAEDRGIEGPILKELIREYESKGGHKFESMIQKFRELDEVYNSSLFSEHPFEKWEEYGGATERVIKILYGKSGYYEYDFKLMPVDVLGSVYENYLGYKLSKSKKGLSINKDATKRKEQGIYYTPDFIVDYIVKNTLKPVLDKCNSIEDLKKIKVLDPACGSGSFLLKALDVIHDKYLEFGSRGGTFTKIDILLNNIYGVDLDNQAVEIARLNLLISALDTRMKLPSLDKNIKNGNSLISGTDEELKKYFGKNYRDKKPFNWQEEFPEVFKQGGFDVIIGNPPYINSRNLDVKDKSYFAAVFDSATEQYDLYGLFIEKCLNLLREKGNLGLIVPNKFLMTKYGILLRKFITENSNVVDYKDYSQENVFVDASVYPVVIIFQKTKQKEINQNGVYDLLNIFGFENKNGLITKIEKQHNLASLKVWRPLATSNNIVDGIDIIISNREVQRYNLILSKKGKISNSRERDSAKNKIILKKLCYNLEASLDSIGYFTVNTTYCIQPVAIDINIKYILGILNSKLMSYYARSVYSKTALKGGYIELRVYQVQTLPIVRVAKTEHDVVVRLVNEILELNKNITEVSTNSEKWLSIKSEIEKIDKAIDQEVYKLYGLSDGEVKIVENGK